MMNFMYKKSLLALIISGLLITTGCSKQEKRTAAGALIGTGAGAAVGGIAGGTNGALIGGAVGGLAGGLIGNASGSDK